jgi:hypothetical protein
MVFIETPIFTRQVLEVLTDEQYALLQGSLVARPDSGVVIRGSSGIRNCDGRCRAVVKAAVFE